MTYIMKISISWLGVDESCRLFRSGTDANARVRDEVPNLLADVTGGAAGGGEAGALPGTRHTASQELYRSSSSSNWKLKYVLNISRFTDH